MFKQYKGLRKELYVLFIGRIMTNLGSMIWPMLTLILNKKIGMNASEVANCLLVFSLVAIPTSLLGGKLTDKFNKKNIIVFCDFISVVFYILCGFMPMSFITVVLIAIAALFQTIEWPAYDALVADFSLPKDRQRAYSLSYLGANFGLMLSPTIGGILFNNYLNVAFFINGLSILSSTLLIMFLIKDTSREESIEDFNEYEVELDNNTNVLKYLFSNNVLTIYLIAMVLYGTVYHQFSFLGPLEMANQYGEYGSVLYGTLSSLNCITVVLLTSFITKLLSNIVDISKCILGAFAVGIGLFIFKLFLQYTFMPYVAIVIFTIGEIISTLGQSPFVSKRIPANYRGRITSVINVFTNIAISLITKIVGGIYEYKGSINAWLIVYFLALISILLLIIVKIIDKKKYSSLYK